MFLLNFLTDQEREHHEYFSGAYSLSELSGLEQNEYLCIYLLTIVSLALIILFTNYFMICSG